MANSNLTELLFIIDRSGSMSSLESDTIGGFNSMINKRKGKNCPVVINTILFDTEIQFLHDRIGIDDVSPMTDREYWARGCTALYDAVGTGINHLNRVQSYLREEDVPGHVVVVITTDGYENASKKYSREMVRELIGTQKEKGWEFIFLGADIDAEDVAESLNIDSDMAFSMEKSSASTLRSFAGIGAACFGAGLVDKKVLRSQLKDYLRENRKE